MIPFLMWMFAGLCGWINWNDRIPPRQVDARKQEAQYINKVYKEDEKENMERKIKVVKDNGFDGYMTVEKYEIVSAPGEKTNRIPEKYSPPKVERPSDMLYVPQPAYKMVRYNNPPGSPEISLKASFWKNKQQNEQGIVSPDYKMMVYPAIYYYPYSASVSCDLFVIPLDESQGYLNRIMAANVAQKIPTPILSTDQYQDNKGTFRTLTPIDFSEDGTKILAKEKVGSKYDGIWRTVPVVYDFEEERSYRLVEVRDAIIHYWKTNRGLNLDDKRWDIYPLGFVGERAEGSESSRDERRAGPLKASEGERIIIDAYAYTGRKSIHLGIWSIDTRGEQSQLVSFDQKDISIPTHGIKIVQDGVVAPPAKNVRASADFEQWKIDRLKNKNKKEDNKAQIKALKKEYKELAKTMDKELKEEIKYFDERNKIAGSTEDMTKRAEQWEAKKAKLDAKKEKAIAKQEAAEVKAAAKAQQAKEKRLQYIIQKEEKIRTEKEKELEFIRSFPDPDPINVPSNVFD